MEDEILLSCHVCHPSLANDNLSGIAVMTFLAQYLQRCPRRYSYRFLFIPGTIGSITWLARNEAQVGKIKHGLVLTCVGDAGPFTYKRSRRGNAVIDRAVPHVLRQAGLAHEVIDFFPYGYDERQYCSPGFNLPVGCLMRARHGQFPEYHTSADNLQFVQPAALETSLALCATILATLDGNACYRNLLPKGEPQLGKRGLYRIIGSEQHARTREMAMLWVLNYADGEHTLLDIAERAGLPFQHLRQAADALLAHQLLADSGKESSSTAVYSPRQTSEVYCNAQYQRGGSTRMNTFHGHIAVVTGAGSGVGQAIACALAAQGATLCLVGRTPATLEATACGVKNAKVTTRCYPTDITHDDAVQALAEQLHREWDAIDILVHSAGVFAMGKLETAPVTDWICNTAPMCAPRIC